MRNSSIICKGISKRFLEVRALHDISFQIPHAAYVCVIGSSGSGKTTLLRILAGLEEPSEGSVLINDVNLHEIGDKKTHIAMVFQDYALFPHLNVFDNIAIGLRIRSVPSEEIHARVHKVAQLLDIEHLLRRRPSQISGGEKQRVALGRAIMKNPDVFLLDEPLANLDSELRVNMRNELKKLQRTIGKTFIHVTHDQFEAFSVADKILLLDKGEIRDFGSPDEVYENPRNIYSASFVGFPKINLIAGTVKADSTNLRFDTADFSLQWIVPPEDERISSLGERNGGLILGARPESMSLAPSGNMTRLGAGIVLKREVYGSFVVYKVQVGSGEYSIIDKHSTLYPIGHAADVHINLSEANLFHEATGDNMFMKRSGSCDWDGCE